MVDLSFTDEEEAFRAELTAWLSANLPAAWRDATYWEAMSDDDAFEQRRRWEQEKALAGFAGIQWPKEYGGRGGTPGMKAIYDEEMRRAHAPNSVNPVGLTFLGPTVMAIGSEEQKRDIIGPMLRAEQIWCQGFSEPGAGSDLAALQCRAELDGDTYVVNGQKIWTTYAVWGDKIFTLVRTSKEESRHAGISMMLIDMDQPGVDARPLKQMSGAREFGEVFFTDARVAATDCLGGIGNGWATAMLLLSFERGSSAMGQYTEFREGLSSIVDVAKKVGRADDPVIRQRLANDLVELECLKYLSWHVLTQTGAGKDLGFEASMTKLQWSETYQRMWETYDDVMGADAVVREPEPGLDLLGHLREAMWSRSVTIWGGSSQVQRNVVAERVLGLPR